MRSNLPASTDLAALDALGAAISWFAVSLNAAAMRLCRFGGVAFLRYHNDTAMQLCLFQSFCLLFGQYCFDRLSNRYIEPVFELVENK